MKPLVAASDTEKKPRLIGGEDGYIHKMRGQTQKSKDVVWGGVCLHGIVKTCVLTIGVVGLKESGIQGDKGSLSGLRSRAS